MASSMRRLFTVSSLSSTCVIAMQLSDATTAACPVGLPCSSIHSASTRLAPATGFVSAKFHDRCPTTAGAPSQRALGEAQPGELHPHVRAAFHLHRRAQSRRHAVEGQHLPAAGQIPHHFGGGAVGQRSVVGQDHQLRRLELGRRDILVAERGVAYAERGEVSAQNAGELRHTATVAGRRVGAHDGHRRVLAEHAVAAQFRPGRDRYRRP